MRLLSRVVLADTGNMDPELMDRDALKQRVRSATADMFEEIARLRMAVEERVASQAQRIQVLEEELADRARHIQHLEGRAAGLQKERDGARQEVEAAGTVAREARERILALEKDLHAATLEIQTLSTEKGAAAAARAQLDGLARDAERLAREKDALLARLAEFQDAGLLAERLGRLVAQARAMGQNLAKTVETLKGFGAGASEAAASLSPLSDSIQVLAASIVGEAERGSRVLPPPPSVLPEPEAAVARGRIDTLIRMVESLERKVEAAAQAQPPVSARPLGEPGTLKTVILPRPPATPDAAIREAIERAFKNI